GVRRRGGPVAVSVLGCVVLVGAVSLGGLVRRGFLLVLGHLVLVLGTLGLVLRSLVVVLRSLVLVLGSLVRSGLVRCSFIAHESTSVRRRRTGSARSSVSPSTTACTHVQMVGAAWYETCNVPASGGSSNAWRHPSVVARSGSPSYHARQPLSARSARTRVRPCSPAATSVRMPTVPAGRWPVHSPSAAWIRARATDGAEPAPPVVLTRQMAPDSFSVTRSSPAVASSRSSRAARSVVVGSVPAGTNVGSW